MKNRIFCKDCNSEEYNIDSELMDYEVGGISFKYTKTTITCSRCGKELTSPDISEANLFEKIYNYMKARYLIDKNKLVNYTERRRSPNLEPLTVGSKINRITAFCPVCKEAKRRAEDYEIREVPVIKKVRDIEIEYMEQQIICKKCGYELYIPELHDSNNEAYNNAFREAIMNG